MNEIERRMLPGCHGLLRPSEQLRFVCPIAAPSPLWPLRCGLNSAYSIQINCHSICPRFHSLVGWQWSHRVIIIMLMWTLRSVMTQIEVSDSDAAAWAGVCSFQPFDVESQCLIIFIKDISSTSLPPSPFTLVVSRAIKKKLKVNKMPKEFPSSHLA